MFPAFPPVVSTPTHPRRLPAWLQGDAGAVLLLVLFFLLPNLPLLLGEVAEHWDGKDSFAPFYHHIASLIRSGSLLRWNPFCSGGSPDFAEPEFGSASPVTLAFGLLAGPGPLGFHLYWLGVWLFGGLGMYVLARALAAPPWGALVSALGFVLSGYYFGHSEAVSVVYNYSFVPWTVWRVRAAMTTGRWQPACEAGALWGLSALAGNPAVQFPASLFLGLVAPVFVLPLPADRAGRWRVARTYAVTMTLLVAVGVVVLLPTYGAFRYEVAGYSHRSQPLPQDVLLSQGTGFSWLTGLFTPAFLPIRGGEPPDWKDYDVAMRLLYCGAPVMVLAGFAAWRRRAWAEWTLLAIGLLFLGLAMGTTLPLRGWLCILLPPMRFMRHAGTFRGFFLLVVTMLAAVGAARVEAARLAADADRRLRSLVGVAGVGAGLAAVSYFWISSVVSDVVLARVPLAAPWHVGFAWVGTLLLCLAAIRKTGFRRFLPGALVVLAAVDLSVAYQFSSDVITEDLPSMAAEGPIGPLDDLGAAGWDREFGPRMNENLYTRRPAFANYTALRNFIQEDWEHRRAMSRFVCGRQRLWFAAGVPTVPPTMEAYQAFKERGNALRTMPVVRHERTALLAPPPADPRPSPETLAAIAAAPAAQPVAVDVVAYHANDLTLRVQAPADGYLLVTERWSRSWETTVNGQPVATDGGNFLFRLVPVRAGENVVAMRFQVTWWYVLIALSWTTLAAVATLARWTRRHQKKPSAPPVGVPPLSPEIAALELVS